MPDLIDAPTVRRFGIGLQGCSESSCPQQAPLNRVLEPGLTVVGAHWRGMLLLLSHATLLLLGTFGGRGTGISSRAKGSSGSRFGGYHPSG